MSDVDDVLRFLEDAELEILGLLPYASNATLLVRAHEGGREGLAVYKPRRGERPLWDFPSGTLCLREYAAWIVSRELGWDIVPPTVLREGPAGFGALQFFIDEDESFDVRRVANTHPEELKKMALFDVVVNNTDRKAGHLIVDTEGKLWGVDHGICFSDEPKLRTVIWDLGGAAIADTWRADLRRLSTALRDDAVVDDLLAAEEVEVLGRRAALLADATALPDPPADRRPYPWPPV